MSMKKIILTLVLLVCPILSENDNVSLASATAIAAIAGAAINAAASVHGNASRNEAQMRENRMAFERSLQAQREANAYNTPSAQVARLKAAGLNPNLMYENGADAGLQTQTPEYTPADIQSGFTPVGDVASSAVNAMVSLREQQNKNRLAESQLVVNSSLAGVNFSKVRFNEAQTKEILETLGYKKEQLSALSQKYRYEATHMFKEWQKWDEEIKKIHADTNLLVQRLTLEANLNEAQVKELESRARNLDAGTQEILTLLPAKFNWYQASGEERWMAVGVAYAQQGVLHEQRILLDKQQDLSVAEREKIEAEIQLKYEKNLREWIYGGVDACVSVAGAVAQFYNPMGTLGSAYGKSPIQQIGSQPTPSTHGGLDYDTYGNSPLWNMYETPGLHDD